MAVPKTKISKSKGRSRIANWKVAVPGIAECPQCHEQKLEHRVCGNCGFYKGEKKIKTASDKKDKKKK